MEAMGAVDAGWFAEKEKRDFGVMNKP